MPTSQSRDAYNDCYELLDKALEMTHGVAASFRTRGEAYHFRTRLNAARQHDRNIQKEVDPNGHSEYDGLMFKIISGDDKWWVKIVKLNGPKEVVEVAE